MNPPAVPAKWAWLAAAVLGLGCLAVFGATVGFGFAPLDDDRNLLFNPGLGPLSPARVAWAFTEIDYTRRWMPLGWLGFSFVFGVGGLEPAAWHLADVLVHTLSALVVFAVLRRLVGGDTPWDVGAAFVGAAFWAWHPQRAESVAWASGLLYSQAILFLFLALWADLAGRRGWALAAFAASLLTYPAGLGLWPVLVVHHAWKTNHSLNPRALLAAVRARWDFGLIAAAILAVTVWCQLRGAGEFGPPPTLAEFPLWSRPLRALAVCGHYLWRPWWPVGLSPVDPVLLGAPGARLLASAALPVVALLLALVVFPARRAAGALFLAHCAALAPVFGVMERVHFPGDRYAFLPGALAALALAAGFARLRARRPAAFVASLALVALGLAARAQSELWRDAPAVWAHVDARLAPADFPELKYARHALWLAREGRPAEARARLAAGLAALPVHPALLAARADVDRAARDSLAVAQKFNLPAPPPPAALLHHRLAAAHLRRGDPEPAARHLREVARRAPAYYATLAPPPPPPPVLPVSPPAPSTPPTPSVLPSPPR